MADIVKLDVPEFPVIDPNKSISYNFLVIQKLILVLGGFSKELVDKIFDVEYSVHPDSLVNEVANLLMEQKLHITIPYDIAIGAMFIHTHNNVNYRIDYVDNFELQIKNLTKPNWDVGALIVQIKNGNGTVIYPTIVCQDHIIKIYFGDTIESTYHIYII
jgi:hypothetical protein